jgi:hypothetical protein
MNQGKCDKDVPKILSTSSVLEASDAEEVFAVARTASTRPVELPHFMVIGDPIETLERVVSMSMNRTAETTIEK